MLRRVTTPRNAGRLGGPAAILLMSAPAISIEPAPARDWTTATELVGLAAIWGGSFLFMRVAVPEFGPAALVLLRLVLGALVLSPFLWPARRRFATRHLWQLPLLGLVMAALPFALFAWAAARAPAGIGAISNATTVLFTALVAFLAFGERLDRRRVFALVLGFVGVVVLAGGGNGAGGSDVAWGAAAGTLGAFCYGVASNLVRRYFSDLPPIALASATLWGASLFALPWATAEWPAASPSLPAWGSAIALGAVCTGLANAFFFRMLQRIGPARAVTVTYLIPVFGVGWAWWLLDEPLTWAMALAAALILVSVALSQRRG